MSDPTLEFAARRLFSDARTPVKWLTREVPAALLTQLYDLLKDGPTSMNTQPLRLKFVVSPQAKETLVACVNPGNVEKTRQAPVIAILGQDLAFPELLPRLFAHKTDARSYYEGKPEVIASTALRNSSLQGGYLIMAARLLGLDCGPMSGFKPAAVDEAFWVGTSVRTNFLCILGYGDKSDLRPRAPRLSFEEACELV